MDNQQKTPKIKIKINGDERPFQEDVEIRDWQKTERETSAAAEEAIEEDGFDWVLPEVQDNEISEFKKIYYNEGGKEKKSTKIKILKPGKKWSSIAVSAVAAVTIGVFLGYLLLKVVLVQEQASKGAASLQETAQEAASSPKTVVSAGIPSLKTAVVQNNIFSTSQSADTTVDEMKGKGLAAVSLPINNQYYLFIGAAQSVNEAKKLAASFQKSDVTVYSKDLTIGGGKLSKATKDEESILKKTVPLFQKLSAAVTGALTDQKVDTKSLQAIDKDLTSIKALKDVKNQHVKSLIDAQNAGYKALVNYSSQKDSKELIAAEQSLLDYIKEYNSL